tara:strand:+ start:708 stop:878 length:171 start_codon:yes stop_codon:yes gene_type:complete
MIKILLPILFFLFSCSQNSVDQKLGNLDISNNMSMEEFKKRLIEYSKTNPYPDIDE